MTAPPHQTSDTVFTEGTLVSSTNDLYKCYGIGRIQKVRGEQAKVECGTMMGKRR